MINQAYARHFVRKLDRSLQLKINVMDEKGIIVASYSPERIGDFHQAAYELVTKNIPMSVTEAQSDGLIGVNAPGVNLQLNSGQELIGVIGVTGEPEEVLPVSKLVKLMFESMYEYELERETSLKIQDSLSKFSYSLLREQPLNLAGIRKKAKTLGFRDHTSRIPIYIHVASEHLRERLSCFSEQYQALSCYSPQDIVLLQEEGILLLKSGPSGQLSYKEFLLELKTVVDWHFYRTPGLEMIWLAAPQQSEFEQYRQSYALLKWLWQRVRQTNGSQIHFLCDHALPCVMEHMDTDMLSPLFEPYCSLILEKLDADLFKETVKGLIDADMKLEPAAKLLHLHKNSVVARLSKIKDVLGINPLNSARDAALLTQIYEFLIRRP